MKPLVGKRVEPRSLTGAEIQSACRGAVDVAGRKAVALPRLRRAGAFLAAPRRCPDPLSGCGSGNGARRAGSRDWSPDRPPVLQLGRGNSPQRVEGGEDSARSSRRGGRVVRRPGEHSHCCVTGGSAVRASGAGTLSWRRASPVVRNRGQVGRSSTRPVLKHGPRSLTCARVTQS